MPSFKDAHLWPTSTVGSSVVQVQLQTGTGAATPFMINFPINYTVISTTVTYGYANIISPADMWGEPARLPVRYHDETWRNWWENADPFTRSIVIPPPPELEEERRARMERQAAAIREVEHRNQVARAARDRSLELLRSMLTEGQCRTLDESGYFYVRAPSGRLYRIDQGQHGNVKVVDGNRKVIERLCIQPAGVPDGDAMLVQKLMIETAEDAFRAHANITLNDGKVIRGEPALLDADRLRTFEPVRRAA